MIDFNKLSSPENVKNFPAEQAVLGGVLINPTKINDVFEILEIDDFSHQAHREIAKTLLKMSKRGKALELRLIADNLTHEHKRDITGTGSNYAYLALLYSETVSAANVLAYAQEVKAKAVFRKLLESSIKFYDMIQADTSGDPKLLISQGKTLFANLAETYPLHKQVEQELNQQADLLSFIPDGHIFKQLTKEVAKASWMPTNTTLIMGMSVFSGFAMRRYVVHYKNSDTALPIGLYALSEHPSGTGKTRIINEFCKPFRTIHKESIEIRRERLASLVEKKQFDTLNFSQEDAEEMEYLEKNKIPKLYTTNGTTAAIEKIMVETKGIFTFISTEKGGVNVMLGRTYSTGENDADILLYGFNGDYHSVDRNSRESFTGQVVGSVTAFAQDGTIDGVIESSNTSGLFERFFIVTDQHLLGQRDHTLEFFVHHETSEDYASVCRNLAEEIAKPLAMDDMYSLTLSDAAWHKINLFRNEFEPLLADGQRYSHSVLRGAIAKINIQIMKLSANLHVSHMFSLGIPAFIVDDRFVDSAINITRNEIRELENILIKKGVIGKNADFEAIEDWIRKQSQKGQSGVTEHHLTRSLRNLVPFKNYTGSITTHIKNTLTEMVKDRLLKVDIYEGKTVYILVN